MSKDKRDKEYFKKALVVVIVVLVVIFIIATFGAFAPSSDDENQKKIEDKKQKKKKRLEDVQARIDELFPKREELEKREKLIFLWSRIVIAFGLVVLNVVYWYYNNRLGKEGFQLGEQLNFIGAVTILYSFIAFVSYGSLDKFVVAMKKKISTRVKKKHIDILLELELLEKERDRLIEDLRGLDEKGL